MKSNKNHTKYIFVVGGVMSGLGKGIAAASIVAKTWRDKLMKNYSTIYPMYGLEKNKGYGTREHRDAIIKFGITKIHRKSFLINLLRSG